MTDLKLRFPEHANNYDSASRYTKFDVDVCVDCYMTIHLPGENDNFEPDGDRTFDLCREWNEWAFDDIYPDDDPDREGEPSHGFSKSQCDGCHTTLHGDRYSMRAAYIGPRVMETT
jgi:hypothetical protein